MRNLLNVIFYVNLLVSGITAVLGQNDCGEGHACVLPQCFCGNPNSPGNGPIPGGLSPQEIPQIVVFSFDDAVNVLNYPFYNRLFPASRKNPNGCPISMTLFVSHNYTDYSMVKALYERGMEIASHSVTHRTPTAFWADISEEDMLREAHESKRLISTLAGIPQDKIYGWRFPFLQPGGDLSYEILRLSGYEYDSSLLTSGVTGNAPQQWPLTLDFGYSSQCVIPPCPQSSQAGFWEIPIVPISDRENIFPCSYIDGCFYQPTNTKEALEILLKNFSQNYLGRRAPLYINMHAWWFSSGHKLEAMEEFIDTILENDDVYIVNFHQMLEWVKNPRRLADIQTFEPWSCTL